MKICHHCKQPFSDSRAEKCSACGKLLESQVSDPILGTVMAESIDMNSLDLNATLDPSDLRQTNQDKIDHSPSLTIDDESPSKVIDNPVGTLDLPGNVPTGTADFLIDDVGVAPTATIHLHQGRLTKQSEPGGTPKTMKGGATFRANLDSENSSSIWSTISRRKLGADNGIADVSADYTIVRKLGEGGMGVVYVAVQKSLDREVAVKAIKSGQANTEESRKKFFYEAQITGELDHPNIVPIHEIGANDDGTLFYSMKMVDGSPWENAIQEKSREENIEIFMKVCDAVAFAHSRDVMHRDLKPENVMLGTFGEVLVMDWGLAVDLKTKPSFGMSGTPAYMSPEMASHQVSKIGKSSDIYILGGILFQILTGRAPHTGKSVRDCLVNAQQNKIVPTDLDDPLLDIARVALSTDPNDRYDSVQSFQSAIRDHLQHAESIALSKRASETLERAIEERDYKEFSRAVFSMQEAIDMWPSNEVAHAGLSTAQLAYGQCALEQGDYDLCIQCLDPKNPTHFELLKNAKEKKLIVQQRESRLRWMRRTLVSVITVATLLLSGATYYANYQASIARKQEKIAVHAAEAERFAKESESLAKLAAIEDRNKALAAAEQERVAKLNEAKAREQAQIDRDAAIAAKLIAEVATEKEAAARQIAVTAEKQATEARNQAIESARYTLLGNYQSLMGLSLSQNSQFNVQRSNQLLRDVDRVENEIARSFETLPTSEAPIAQLKNWAYRRIELLNNADLEKTQLKGRRPIIDISRGSPFAIVSSERGNIELLKWNSKSWVLVKQIKAPGPVVAIAISQDGLQSAFVIKSENGRPSLFHWNTQDKEVAAYTNAPGAGLEFVRFVNDDRSVIAGITGGIWKWKSPAEGPSRMEVRGKLLSLECFGRDQSKSIGVLSIPNADVSCVYFDWSKDSASVIALPAEITIDLCSAGMAQNGKVIYLGGRDGKLWYGVVSEASRAFPSEDERLNLPVSLTAAVNVTNLIEVTPRKHTAAIHGIRTTEDHRFISYGDEPVVHTWQHSNQESMPHYECFLAGLLENVEHSQFADDTRTVVGVDNLGTMLSWSIDDQIRRQSSVATNSVAPVVSASEHDGEQLWIDEQGTVLIKTKRESETAPTTVREYFGHTPGAVITDTAVAKRNPWLATAARLRGPALAYLAKNRDQIEVCIWNVADGSLLKRQLIESEQIGRVTFIEEDRSLLMADGTGFHLMNLEVSPERNRIETKNFNFGPVFGVVNPVHSNQVALIAKSGAVRILDLNRLASWDDEAFRYFDLAINNRNEPIQAVWSPNGDRLYILFDHGGLTRLDWTGRKFVRVQSAELPDLKCESPTLPWSYVDFCALPSADNMDNLRFAFRSDNAATGTRLAGVTWRTTEANPASPIVSQNPIQQFLQPSGNLIARTESNGLVATEIVKLTEQGECNVAVLKDGCIVASLQKNKETKARSFGRQVCLGAAVSLNHQRMVLHQSNQSVIFGQRLDSPSLEWSSVEHPLDRVSACKVSPDGNRLILLGVIAADSVAIEFQFNNNNKAFEIVRTLVSAKQAVWHPARKEFLFLRGNQTVTAAGQNDELKIDVAERWDPNLETVSDIYLHHEPWSSDRPADWHLVLLIQKDSGSRLAFAPLTKVKKTTPFEDLNFSKKITAVATHGHDGLLFLGDETGVVSVWFASPTLDRSARELFTLPGHRGAKVKSISVSSDGNTLLTNDAQRRSFYWPSSIPKR